MHYISSFSDNAVSLKSFLNEEISRLKVFLENSLENLEISSDEDMKKKKFRKVQGKTKYGSPLQEKVIVKAIKRKK